MEQFFYELEEGLKKSEAPLTKRKVACALVTNNGCYTGHNIERDRVLVHAEKMALEKLADPRNARNEALIISEVHIAGSGQAKFNQISPCYDCYRMLLQFVNDSTRLVLHKPDALFDKISFSFLEVKRAYAARDYSKIEGVRREQIINELKQKTRLTDEDLELIADTVLLGRKEKARFLLTGSAGNRSRLSPFINDKLGINYRDIDLCLITAKDSVKNLFKELVERHRPLRRIEQRAHLYRAVHITTADQPYFEPCEQHPSCSRNIDQLPEAPPINLVVGKTIEEVIKNKDYLRNNWFHELS